VRPMGEETAQYAGSLGERRKLTCRRTVVSMAPRAMGQGRALSPNYAANDLRNLERNGQKVDNVCCMSSAIRRENDFWPEHAERGVPQQHTHVQSSSSSWLWNVFFSPRTETRVGSLTAAAGLIMAAHSGTVQISSLANLTFPPGPLETCAIGLLVWIHAKWRHATRLP